MATSPKLSISPATSLVDHSCAVTTVQFNPINDKILASCSNDQTVKLWEIHQDENNSKLLNNTLQSTFDDHQMGISHCNWDHSGKYLATASDDGLSYIYDVEKECVARVLLGNRSYVTYVCFNPLGNIIATGSHDKVLLWDLRTSKALQAIEAHSDPITSIEFSYDSFVYVTTSNDGFCRLWETISGKCITTMIVDENAPIAFARFTENCKYLLISSLNDGIGLWDYRKTTKVRSYSGHKNSEVMMNNVLFKEGQEWFVGSGSETGDLHFWDQNSEEEVLKYQSAYKGSVVHINVNSSRTLLAGSSIRDNEPIKVWNLDIEKEEAMEV